MGQHQPQSLVLLQDAQDKMVLRDNLLSSWRNQTEDEQRRVYDEIGLGEFTEVKPLPCTDAGNASQPPADDGTPLPF